MVKKILILFAALVFSAQAIAEEVSGVTVFPHFGKIRFDLDSGIDINNHFGVGFGYQFESPWALELILQNTNPDLTHERMGDVDINTVSVNALYHFDTDRKIRPFASFSMGKVDYDFLSEKDDTEVQYKLGLGLKWELTDSSSLRSDFNFFKGNGDGSVDATVSVGIHFALGEKKPVVLPPPPDSDSDGVPDTRDQCPGTPVGVQVDSSGCPRDDDGDGVANHLDKCAGTTNPRAIIDAQGCYVMTTEAVSIELNLEFDFDSSEVRPVHESEVGRVADFMGEHPQSDVVVEGHTDSTGTEAYNQKLSERRASTIADILVENFGIGSERITSKGYGETQPVDTNSTKEGRQNNRRVVAKSNGETEVVQEK